MDEVVDGREVESQEPRHHEAEDARHQHRDAEDLAVGLGHDASFPQV
jgi:hypothetical protein